MVRLNPLEAYGLAATSTIIQSMLVTGAIDAGKAAVDFLNQAKWRSTNCFRQRKHTRMHL